MPTPARPSVRKGVSGRPSSRPGLALAVVVWAVSSAAAVLVIGRGAVLEGMVLAALGGALFGVLSARRFDGVVVRVRRRRGAKGGIGFDDEHADDQSARGLTDHQRQAPP